MKGMARVMDWQLFTNTLLLKIWDKIFLRPNVVATKNAQSLT